MEKLDYLIRTFTYKRSCLELDLKFAEMTETLVINGKIDVLNIVITEIYKLIESD